MYSITDSGLPSELVLSTATSLAASRSGTSERSPSSLTVSCTPSRSISAS